MQNEVDQELKIKLEKFRSQLLDLTARNPGIKFSHKPSSKNPNRQRFLRIVLEAPELLIKRLGNGKRIKLLSNPKDSEFKLELSSPSKNSNDLVKTKDNTLQVFEEEPKFSIACDLIRKDTKSYQEDKGINVLYLAIGFVNYVTAKSTKEGEERQAPLILYPIKITREKTGKGYNYFIEGEDNEFVLNEALIKKLNLEDGIKLPNIRFNQDGTPLIESYLKEVGTKLIEKNEIGNNLKWELKRWATIGIFKFGKLAIYNDLDFDSWLQNPLQEKDLIKDFVQGVRSKSIEEIGNMDITQDDHEKSKILGQIPKLIADADSTQYKVIVKALEGKSMTVEGPPGTGKSQTITNIIGGLLSKNKKILFAADKLAALQVVKKRLKEKRIDDFILELHSPTKSKKEFHENLRERIARHNERFNEISYKNSFKKLKDLRNELSDHVETVNSIFKIKDDQISIFDIIWDDIRNKININKKELLDFIKQAENISLGYISRNSVESIESLLDLLVQSTKSIQGENKTNFLEIKGLPDKENDVQKLIRESTNGLKLINEINDLLIKSKIDWKNTLDFSKKDIEKSLKDLQSITDDSMLSDNYKITKENADLLSNIFKLVEERESKEVDIEKCLQPFLLSDIKFSGLKSNLEEINRNIPITYNESSLNSFLEDLEKISQVSRHYYRQFRKEEVKFISLISYNKLKLALMFYKEIIDKDYNIDEISNFIIRSQSLDELNEIFLRIKSIQYNSLVSKKLIESGIDPSKILRFSKEDLLTSIESIKKSNFLGCILDKKIRKAKSIWRKVSIDNRKRPSLKKLAKVYTVSIDYIEKIQSEEEINFANISVEGLRELSNSLHLDDDYVTLLNDIKSAFSQGEELPRLFEIIRNQSSNALPSLNTIPLITEISDLKLDQCNEFCNNIISDITSKTIQLGDEAKLFVLRSNPKDLEFYLRELNDLKLVINKLSLLLNNTIIDNNENLKYEIDSISVKSLLSKLSNIDFGKINKLYPFNLEDKKFFDIKQILSNLNILAVRIQTLDDLLSDEIIKKFITSNLSFVDKFINYRNNIADVKNNFLFIESNKENFLSILENKRLIFRLNEYGLGESITHLVKLSLESDIKCSFLFRCAYANSLVRKSSLEEKLKKFTGNALNAARNEFIKLDEKFISDTSIFLSNYLDKPLDSCLISSSTGTERVSPKDLTEGDLIMHENKKSTRHIPYRKLFKRAFNSLSRLKPCWMMSPATAAQFLPKKIDIFDVLIIDEASQMRPEEALGLIARSKQVIIVGDQKQLPPDNRYQKNLDDDDDDYIETVDIGNNESILELASKVLGTDNCSLGWHYRSRHHSLINFSNYYIYNNDLTVFSSNKIGSEVKLVRVDNPYYHKSVNLREAEDVINAFHNQIKEDPSKTILIATMNRYQKEIIEIELEKLVNKDPQVEEYVNSHRGTLEELRIQNLENIQGDERDVVIVSTVFGPDANGRVLMTFGDITKRGGERRLNVLFTRAKYRVILVTSLKASDIRTTSSLGLKLLKDYLAYAESGKLIDTGVRKSGMPVNSFEESIMNAIIKKGYEVDAQVGSLNYSIDLAIKDPKDSSKYILAVECDGATYHSSYSARTNDRLRQQVLEGLGWEFFRIWSIDWRRDPQQELDSLDKRIKELTEKNSINI